MHLERAEYERIIRVFPRVCVDIMIVDPSDRLLLLKRTNQPAIGQWWFPGGRVLIGETRLQAARRKLLEECGLGVAESALPESGSLDLFFEIDGTTYQDATILFELKVDAGVEIVTDAEASAYGWFTRWECASLGLHSYLSDNIGRHLPAPEAARGEALENVSAASR